MKASPIFSIVFLARIAAFAAVLATLLLLAGCSDAQKTVRGHILDVQASSLTDVASLTLLDAEGKVWRFEAQGNLGFTPSHIREHMMQGEEMTVTYREKGDDLVALRVAD